MMPSPGTCPSAGDLGPRLFHQIPGFDLTRNLRNLEEMVCASKQHAICFAGKISIDSVGHFREIWSEGTELRK
jgi:hypothetical protein